MILSKRFTNILALTLAVLMLAGCGGAESRKAKYLDRGKEYLAQENYDKARIEFKNVLQIDPKSAEGYFYMGQTEQSARNPRVAIRYYLKALELKPDYRDAQIKMARFYLALADKKKARELTDAILAKDPSDLEGRTLNAAILAVDNDMEKAIKEASEVLKADPAHADAVDLLFSIYEKQGQTDKAIEVLEKGVAANRKSILLRMNLVKLYASKNELTKAENLLKDVIELEPANLQNRTNLALFYARINQTDKAENTLREAVKADPKDAQRRILLADFLANRRGFEAAEKELVSAIEESPKENQLRFALAALYERTRQLDKMEDVYRKIISQDGTNPDGLRAMNDLATLLLLQNKKMDEVVQLNEEVLKKNPRDNKALEIKGRLALAKKNPPEAISAFRTILKDQPEAANILTLLAEAHFANGEQDLARDNLLKALEHNPGYLPARARMAQFYTATGNFNDALKIIEDGLKTAPTDMDLLVAKASVLAAKKDNKGVRRVFESIKTSHPESPVGYYRMGQLLAAERKYDLALREFEAAWEKSPNAPETLVAIVNMHVAQGKPDKAVSRLNDVLKKLPQNAFVHELLGEVYAGQKKYTEAEAEFRKAIEISPKWTQSYGSLAKLLQARGDHPGSVRVFEQGLQAVPDDVTLLLYLAGAHERTGAFDKAIDVYERVLQKDKNNDIAANNLAALLVDHRADKKSHARALELAQRFQSVRQPYFRDTLGWVYFRNGDTDKAIEVLDKVVSELPDVAVFRYHLGMAYYQKGDLNAAKNHLTKAVAGKNEFPGKAEAQSVLQKIQ